MAYTSSLSSYGDNVTISPTEPPLNSSSDATNMRFDYLPHTQFLGLTPSDCVTPTNFAASNITENSAVVSWDASTTATSYRVIYKANESFNPANDTSAEVVTSTDLAAELTLEPTTVYYAYVQAICSDTESSSFAGPIEIETPAAAADLAPQNVPYTQDFEVTQPLPIGWNIASNSGNNWEVKENASLAHSGENFLRYFYDRSQNADSWIFSIGMNLEADKVYDVSFWQRVFNDSNAESLQLNVGNAQTTNAQTTILWDNANLTNVEYEERTASFSPETDGVYYFAFHAYSPANRFAIFVDDFHIDETLSTTDIDTNKNILSVYPNPVKDGVIYLTTEQLDQQELDVKLFNIQGKVVLNQKFNNIQNNIKINVQHLPEGKYFLQYSNSKEQRTIPVLIK